MRSRARNCIIKPPNTWTPKTPGNLKTWLESDLITGLSDNTALQTWSDASGNSYSPTQGTSSKRPKYRTGVSQFNSHAAVRFDGVDDILMITGLTLGGTTYTVYIVWRMIGANAGGGPFGFLAAGKRDESDSGLFVTYPSGTTTEFLYRNSEVCHVSTPAVGTAMLSTVLFDGSNGNLRVNTTTGTPAARTASFAGEGFQLGSRYNGTVSSAPTNLDIAAILLYSSAIAYGSANDTLIKSYLSKYGV